MSCARASAILLAIFLLVASRAETQTKSDFCIGFEEGWKTVKGEISLVPFCPLAPLTPMGSTPYREGIKAGMAAGRRAGGGQAGGGSPEGATGTFCDGFSEGWKAVKGEMSLVPLCPLPPLTPLGSTPYREGLKAGMARARRP